MLFWKMELNPIITSWILGSIFFLQSPLAHRLMQQDIINIWKKKSRRNYLQIELENHHLALVLDIAQILAP